MRFFIDGIIDITVNNPRDTIKTAIQMNNYQNTVIHTKKIIKQITPRFTHLIKCVIVVYFIPMYS